MEFGLYTFADVMPDPVTGRVIGAAERLANLLEEIELADQLGLDVFAIGEHHRPDYAVSAPAVVLAAGAARTERIRLSSAVSVLSSDDPVRVFQQFATLDLLSGGRAEIMAGRGSFTESFPLFGQDLRDYDDLFAEKLDLLLAIREQVHVTWSGRHRAPLDGQGVYPRPVQDPLPVWIAVGGSPAVGGPCGHARPAADDRDHRWQPGAFGPLVELYREPAHAAGHDRRRCRSASTRTPSSPRRSRRPTTSFIRPTLQAMNKIGRERGWPPPSRPSTARCAPCAARSPSARPRRSPRRSSSSTSCSDTSATFSTSLGGVEHADVLRSMELFGTEVAPLVRAELGVSAG